MTPLNNLVVLLCTSGLQSRHQRTVSTWVILISLKRQTSNIPSPIEPLHKALGHIWLWTVSVIIHNLILKKKLIGNILKSLQLFLGNLTINHIHVMFKGHPKASMKIFWWRESLLCILVWVTSSHDSIMSNVL